MMTQAAAECGPSHGGSPPMRTSLARIRLGACAHRCNRRRAGGMEVSASAGHPGSDPEQVWAALLATTQRAVQAGAVSSIDTRAECVVDKATGVEVRHSGSRTPSRRLTPVAVGPVCVAGGDDVERQAAEASRRRERQSSSGEPVPAL